jgi:tetratricopeptide (TPR) repeat protein
MKWLEALDTRKIVLIIGLAASLAYANALGGQFVVDDTEQIVANQEIRSWSTIGQAFTTHVWAFQASGKLLRVPMPLPYYRPIFTVVLTVGYHIFGLWPQGWHLISLSLHIICSIGVYLVLFQFSSNKAASLVSALLFAVYPIHAESVCWISGMTDPLYASFFLFSFFSYLKYRAGESPRWWLWISLTLFTLSILSKEPAMAMVPLVFAYEMLGAPKSAPPDGASDAPQVPRQRSIVRAASLTLPFAAVAILYLVARFLALGALVWSNPAAHKGPFTDTLLTLPLVVISYATHLLWPVGLTFAYHTHSVTNPSTMEFLGPAIILGVSGCLLLAYRQHIRREVWFALALIFIPLLPVLDLKQLNEEYMVWDRYLYLPAMGVCYLVALGSRALVARFTSTDKMGGGTDRDRHRVLAPVVLAGLLCILTIAAAGENRAWADSYSLWSKAATVRPGFWAAHYDVGLVLLDQGQFARALGPLQRAAQLAPAEPSVFDALGRTYRALGERDQAIASFEQALHLDPTFFESLNNLGTVYFDGGEYGKAEQCFVAALTIKPRALDARYNLGLSYVRDGRYRESIREFESIVGASPDDAQACYELGQAYAAAGRSEDARGALLRSLGLAKSKEVSDRVSEALEKLQSQ